MITKADIEKYFLAEKQAGILLICIAAITVIIALVCLLIIKTNTWKGIAIPFLIFAFIEAAVGYNAYQKNDSRRIDNVYALDMNPGKLISTEIPRIEKVKKQFVFTLAAEILLFAAGIFIVAFLKSFPEKQLIRGIGIGLIIQSSIALGIDLFACSRAKNYDRQLQTLVQKN